MAIPKIDNQIQKLIKVSQTLTGAYVDLWNGVNGGPLIKPMDCSGVALWLKLDVNDSTGVRVRMLAAQSEDATDFYSAPIKAVTASVVNVTPYEMQFANNVDQNLVITFPLSDQLPFVKFQVMATVVGVTAGVILDAGLSFTSAILGSD